MAGASVGAVSGGATGRGRRSLDAEINLVPFIDLLSMCISFLLLTAVWINIGAVQIKQSHGTKAATPTREQYELGIRFRGPLTFEVETRRGGAARHYTVQAASPQELIARFNADLGAWNETRDGKAVSAVRVTPVSSVSYGELVNVMDVLRKHQIVNLAVLPGSAS